MTTTRVQPRGDLALMTGYHSPQLDVPVRLNTNESPVGPPTAWVDVGNRVAPWSVRAP